MALALDTPALSSRAAAEAYIGGVCFKLGPPELVGAEVEWFTGVLGAGLRRPSVRELAETLGGHAPQSVSPASDHRPLAAGSVVTVEPGGQVELSTRPFADPRALCEALCADRAELVELLSSGSITIFGGAADQQRVAERVLEVERYREMERLFDRIGPYGRLMMCNTSAVQVSVDAGATMDEAARRWDLLNTAGPALIAAFAASPRMCGANGEQWVSQRMRSWLQLDPHRTAGPETDGRDLARDYARWALSVPLLFVVRDGGPWTAPPDATFADWIDGHLDDLLGRRPLLADLDQHLSTLFPPVRACGHLEARYFDAQPEHGWTVPIAVLHALTSAPAVVDEALRLSRATGGRWREAARTGLADPELRRTAHELLTLATEHAADEQFGADIARAARRCRRGHAPIEEGCR